MTAINQENWDLLATQIVRFSDALGEDFFDRPGTVDEDFFNESVLQLRGLYSIAFESYLPREQAEQVTKLLEEIAHLGYTAKDYEWMEKHLGRKAPPRSNTPKSYHEALPHLAKICEILPELHGRYERYEESVIRRRDAALRIRRDAVLTTIFDRHARGECAFFFDLDGSLVHAKPGLHTGYGVDARLQRVLNHINIQSGNAMAVVTGRPDVFVEQVFPGGVFFTATEHGVIVRDRVGGTVQRSFTGDVDIATLSDAVQKEMVAQGLDPKECYVENYKSGSLTAQFTEASDPKYAAKVVKDILSRIVASPENVGSVMPLKLVDGNVPGNRVMDLVPDTADKGQTLAWLYKTYPHVFAGKVPVVLGDSGGDLTAMEFAIANGGYAIGVGPKAPKPSQTVLYDVRQAREVFTSLAEHAQNIQGKRAAKPFHFVL